jgi:hypothetical protein
MLGKTRQLQITSVDFYDNPALTKRFEAAKQGLTAKKEEWVFHGTSAVTAQNNVIMQEGFLVGGADTSAITGKRIPIATGAAYGQGVYTARGPNAPVKYAAGGGCQCIILAKALLGVHVPDTKPHETPGGADSWTPAGHEGDWVVVARKELLLPCYVVHDA